MASWTKLLCFSSYAWYEFIVKHWVLYVSKPFARFQVKNGYLTSQHLIDFDI
jgi:hypothetical protein